MRARVAALAVLVAILPAGRGEAGNGTFDSGTNKFNMVFSVRWNATPEELDAICAEIQTASGILLDATDGGNQFGVVLIANGSTASNAADYWILKQDGTSSAPTCHFGESGQHCTLYRGSGVPASRWEEVIIHETAHYVYCVKDEYQGPSVGSCGAADCDDDNSAECIVAAGSACLMEGPDSDDSEFCWSGNHDPDDDTEQECKRCQSCWETIASKPYNVPLPAGAPVEAAPAADAIACLRLPTYPRVTLVLDRSGSMGGARLVDAKKAAKLVVDLLETGTELGIVSFSDAALLDYDLQSIDNAADRAAAKAAIDGLAAGGNTNYSSGLELAHSEITSNPQCTNESVIFLSDGANNRPLPDPDGTLFATIQDMAADNIVVNTIGIGDDLAVADEDRLRDMAEDTDGEYYRTPIGTTPKAGDPTIALSTVLDIKPNFARTWAHAAERTEVASRAGDIPPGIPVCDTVRVDSTTGEATFLATWRPQGTQLPLVDFHLVKPDGNPITPAQSGDPGILYVADPGSQYAFYKISPPAFQPGVWQVCFLVQQIPQLLSVTYQVFSRSLDIWTTCRTDRPRAYGFGEDVLLHATAYHQAPLSNFEAGTPEKPWHARPATHGIFTMTGRLLSPEGAVVYTFPLADDGAATSGDAVVGDGQFTGRIPALLMQQLSSGSFTACIDIANYGGAHYAAAHAKPDAEEGVPPPIPNFVRKCCTSVVYDSNLDPTAVPEGSAPGAPLARILAAVPNPFNPGTRIEYEIARAAHAELDIYDVRGQLVRRLVHGRLEAGRGSTEWDGRDESGTPAPSGVYFVVLRAGDGTTSHKVQLVR